MVTLGGWWFTIGVGVMVHIGLLEFHRAAEVIDEGEAAVERAMPDIKAALAVLGYARQH